MMMVFLFILLLAAVVLIAFERRRWSLLTLIAILVLASVFILYHTLTHAHLTL